MGNPIEIVANTSIDCFEVVSRVKLYQSEVVKVKIVVLAVFSIKIALSIFLMKVDIFCLVFFERPSKIWSRSESDVFKVFSLPKIKAVMGTCQDKLRSYYKTSA